VALLVGLVIGGYFFLGSRRVFGYSLLGGYAATLTPIVPRGMSNEAWISTQVQIQMPTMIMTLVPDKALELAPVETVQQVLQPTLVLTPGAFGTVVSDHEVNNLPGITPMASGECPVCNIIGTHVFRVRASITNYVPENGGSNCWRYENGKCISAMRSGLPWQLYYGVGAACATVLPDGTLVPKGSLVYVPKLKKSYFCLDTGGAIVSKDGLFLMDVLEEVWTTLQTDVIVVIPDYAFEPWGDR
jgi:3D (Asp-Asp-Asp) domain-containing protein